MIPGITNGPGHVDHPLAVGTQAGGDIDDEPGSDAHIGRPRAAPDPSTTVPPRTSRSATTQLPSSNNDHERTTACLMIYYTSRK